MSEPGDRGDWVGDGLSKEQVKMAGKPPSRQIIRSSVPCKDCGREIDPGFKHDCPGPALPVLTLPGGTTRSERAPSFHLVPYAGTVRVTRRFELGAEVHGPNNWKKSIHESEAAAAGFCLEAYNHMMKHAIHMTSYDPNDDNIAAVGWAVFVLAYAEQHWGKPWTELHK